MPGAVEVVVDEPDADVFVVDVVVFFGWVVAVVELGPDDPHAAMTSAPAATSRLNNPAPRDTETDTPYASTVRSANRSAKRRCASARRVGMCSVGTSCGS